MSPPDSVPFSMPPSHPDSASASQMSLFPTIPSHHAQYSVYTVPSPPRQYSAHATSSAFSASANADEDWTQISDLAERRRIQNRIAQRNYRKKLKRRLEDLERRAGSSDGASAAERPVFAGVGKKRQTKKSAAAQQQQQRQQQQQDQHDQHQQDQLHQQQQHHHHQPHHHHHHHHSSPPQPKHVPQPGYTPPSHHDDEIIYPQTTYGERDRSDTPPLFPYSTYPPPSHDDMVIPAPAPVAYSSAPPYQQQAMTAAENYPTYLASSAPVTLPSLTHFSEPHIKREPYSGNGEDAFTPYIGYGFIPGIDVNAPSPYDPSNPHTPPLTHFDNSASCSEAGYEYPATPLSIPPESPSMVPRQR